MRQHIYTEGAKQQYSVTAPGNLNISAVMAQCTVANRTVTDSAYYG